MRIGRVWAWGIGSALATAAACAASENTNGVGNSSATGGAGGRAGGSGGGSGDTPGSGASTTGATSSGGAGAKGGNSNPGGTGGFTNSTGGQQADADVPDVSFNFDASTPDATLTPDTSCAATVVRGEPTALDLYVMLDKSGSMLEQTAGGATKWDATRAALTGFFDNPASDGIGVGIQYFPLIVPGTPDSCTSDADCGAAGPCLLRTCAKPGNNFTPCSIDADCGGRFACEDLGYCTGDPNYYCRPVGSTACGSLGECRKLARSYCFNAAVCTAADYAAPAEGIIPLPGSRQALVNSMNQQTPEGATPTGPALQGAIDYARSYAQQNAYHTVSVVLATDGLPTVCAPQAIADIAQIAATGTSGTPSVKTFVIGVFASGDTASQADLDQIAQSGGTSAAYIVDTSQNVAAQLTAALDAIRGSTLGCEFQMPTTDAGIVDPEQVQVRYTASGVISVIPRVTGGGACSGQGWYYDSNASPSRILLCPASCTAIKSDASTQVDVSLGCLGS